MALAPAFPALVLAACLLHARRRALHLSRAERPVKPAPEAIQNEPPRAVAGAHFGGLLLMILVFGWGVLGTLNWLLGFLPG